MHLVRFRDADGKIRAGVLVRDRIRIPDSSVAVGSDPLRGLLTAGEDGLRQFEQAADRTNESRSVADVKVLSPLREPSKIVCVGLNYRSHMLETNSEQPGEPVIFSKFASSIIGPSDAIVIPAAAPKRVDYEAELAVVIGREGRNIAEADALAYVAGYTVSNDISARDWQLRKPSGQWLLGKTFETFLPLGPAIVTADEVPDYHTLRITCKVSGDLRQDALAEEMLFSVEAVIAYVSRVFRLEPGDLILTGTPAGVGFVRQPPAYLRESDVVETSIDGIGVLTNPVVAAPSQ